MGWGIDKESQLSKFCLMLALCIVTKTPSVYERACEFAALHCLGYCLKDSEKEVIEFVCSPKDFALFCESVNETEIESHLTTV